MRNLRWATPVAHTDGLNAPFALLNTDTPLERPSPCLDLHDAQGVFHPFHGFVRQQLPGGIAFVGEGSDQIQGDGGHAGMVHPTHVDRQHTLAATFGRP